MFQENLKRLHPLLRSFVEKGPCGCSMMVYKDGAQVFEDYVGYADQRTKDPVTSQTIFRMHSMTKVITCTAALMLYERGLYALNDPLYEYLPQFRDMMVYRRDERGVEYTSPAKNPILVRDLFTMSTGITARDTTCQTSRDSTELLNRLNADGTYRFSVQHFAQEIANIPLAFDPGTHWYYGMSHDVLGAFIEVVSGKTFGQFLEDEIFSPLGMKDTSFRLSQEKTHRLSKTYLRKSDGSLIENHEHDPRYLPGAQFESGAGGLLSTLQDYMTFANVLAHSGQFGDVRLLSRKTISLMTENHLNESQMKDFSWPYLAGYGYGLGVRTFLNKAIGGVNGSIGEFGWCGLAGTWVLIDPSEQLAAVYMQQMHPNFEEFHQPRLRAVIYGAL